MLRTHFIPLLTLMGGLLSGLLCPAAFAADKYVNPGTMGPNALAPYPADTPWAPEYTRFQVGGAAQITPNGDLSFTPTLRLELPFGQRAVAFVDYMPVELWSVSLDTMIAWGTTQERGYQTGDLRFGGKYLLFDGENRYPSVALRALTKTTTGKGYENRRFSNAPGYEINAIIGYPLLFKNAHRLEFVASGGFFAWQQGANGQNDAFTWSGTVVWKYLSRAEFRAEGRGYAGWQKGDKPVVLGIVANVHLRAFVGLQFSANFGLKDAALFEGRLALEFKIPAIFPVKKSDFSVYPPTQTSKP